MRVAFNPPFILRFRGLPRGLLVLCILLSLMFPASGLADEVRLRNGDVVDGTILDRSDAQIILDHADLGRLTIPTNAIDSISETDAAEDRSAAQTAGTSSDDPEEPGEIAATKEGTLAMAGEIAEPEDKWSLGVVFGGSFSNDDEGEKISFNVRGNADRKVPGLETGMSLSYLYKLDNKEVDEKKLTVILNQLWLRMESPWLYSAMVRYDFDEFRSWRQRIQGQGGVGYRFINREDLRLYPSVGLGFRKDIDSEEEALLVEAFTGITFNWESKSGKRLKASAMYFRALNDDEYRFVNMIDWKIPFVRKGRLSFNTHVDYEYASNPDPGFPPNNISLTWGLQWDF